MAEVAAAIGAKCFSSYHSVGGVFYKLNGAFKRIVKRRPTAVAFKLLVALEQWAVAGTTHINPIFKMEIVFPGPWIFGSFFTKDMVAFLIQKLPPFRF